MSDAGAIARSAIVLTTGAVTANYRDLARGEPSGGPDIPAMSESSTAPLRIRNGQAKNRIDSKAS